MVSRWEIWDLNPGLGDLQVCSIRSLHALRFEDLRLNNIQTTKDVQYSNRLPSKVPHDNTSADFQLN